MRKTLKIILLFAAVALSPDIMAQISYSGPKELPELTLPPTCDPQSVVLSEAQATALLNKYGTLSTSCDDMGYIISTMCSDISNDDCKYVYADVIEITDRCGNSCVVTRKVSVNKSDGTSLTQAIEPENYEGCSGTANIPPTNTPAAIRSYLSSHNFHVPSCWKGTISYSMVNNSLPEKDGCNSTYERIFIVRNEGCSENVIRVYQDVIIDESENDFFADEESLNEIFTFGCSHDEVPEPCTSVQELELFGVHVHNICNDEFNLTVKSEDHPNGESSDGYLLTDRVYTISDGCDEHEPIELHQDIKIASDLWINGRLETQFFTDSPSEPTDLSVNYLKNHGMGIHYTCNEEDLSVEFIEDEPKTYGSNEEVTIYKRKYRLSCVHDYIQPRIIEEIWKKRNVNVTEFSIETVDCTNEGSKDGALYINVPENDEFCPDSSPENSYNVELEWTSFDGAQKRYSYPDGTHPNPFCINDLEGGEYVLRVYPNCPDLIFYDKHVYYAEFEIKECTTEVHITPWMSFSANSVYCEMFADHISTKKGKDGVETSENIIRDKESGWLYDWTTSYGEFMSKCDEPGGPWSINANLDTHFGYGGYEFKRDLVLLKLTRKGNQPPRANVTFTAHYDYKDRTVIKDYTRPAYFGFYNDSYDPNMITGPTGYGNDSIISTKDRIDYKISFENSPDFATAAASRVTINCPLHEKADPKTVRLGQFGFGDFIYEVPELSSHYNNRIDLADTLGVWLDVTAGLDIEKNEVYWIFQSIDPETGVQPNDTIGFLPVNDTLTGCGEGFVSFSITTFEDTKTGDTITERASIVFDENDVIPTNTCTNMFDAVAPTSVLYGDTTGVYSNYVLNFKALACDDEGGSGIGNVELFVNADKTEYVSAGRMVKDSVSDTLRGSFNIGFSSLYQFVCLATDNVGNKELFKDSPEFEFVNNNPPTDIFLSNRFFDEDVKIGTLIGKITTTDDQDSNEFEYSLVEGEGDDDNSLFRIDADKLKTNHDFRCGDVYSFRVRIQSKDVNGDSIQKAFYLYANETATPPVTVLNQKLCFGETYTFGGMELSEVGVYYDTLHTVHGCDSVVKLNLIHYPDPVITYYDQPNCEGEDFEYEEFNIPWDSIENNFISSWNRQNDTTLVFKIDVENADKCSDTLWLNMLLHPKKYDSHDITICENGLPFGYGDSLFSEGGQKFVHFTTADGCDSIVTVNLTVEHSYYNIEKFDTICDNEEYVIFSDTITEPGLHFVVGKTDVHHCDSVVLLRLATLPTYDKVFEQTICPSNLPLTYEGFDIPVDAVSGEMLRYETAVNGCDSIIHLDLTVREADTQINEFYGGWYWYSTYLDMNEIDGLKALEDSLGDNGIQIKSQTRFAMKAGDEWIGDLDEIENEQMYMIKTADSIDVDIFSCLTTGDYHPITIKKGWNWIGYVSNYSNTTENALGTLTPQDGDIIKSYDQGFAAYYNILGGWFGSLNIMQPGLGYMYYSSGDADMNLIYPQPAKDGGQKNVTLPTYWKVNNGKFPNNMTFIGKITIDNIPTTTDNLEVGVFCNGEVRGSGRAILMEGLGTYRLFVQVYGNQGDELTFRLYDHRRGCEHDAKSYQKVYFADNANYGSIHDPYPFKFYTNYTASDDFDDNVLDEGNEDDGNMTDEEVMSHELTLVPNPAKSSTKVLLYCDFTPEERDGLLVEVFNGLGVKIQQIEPTRYPVQLNEIENAGSYMVRVTTGTGRILTKKLVTTR